MQIRIWEVILALVAHAATAQAQSATLALDSQSFISYSDSANAPIPMGSAIRFHFGTASPDGSIPITIEPGDVTIAPVPIGEGATIRYALASTASGTLRSVAGAREIELLATLVATLDAPGSEAAPVAYQLRFTTGTAQAANASETESVTVEGTPAAPSKFVRLVGAATNQPDAFPGPGEAVYAVLSGAFDALPEAP